MSRLRRRVPEVRRGCCGAGRARRSPRGRGCGSRSTISQCRCVPPPGWSVNSSAPSWPLQQRAAGDAVADQLVGDRPRSTVSLNGGRGPAFRRRVEPTPLRVPSVPSHTRVIVAPSAASRFSCSAREAKTSGRGEVKSWSTRYGPSGGGDDTGEVVHEPTRWQAGRRPSLRAPVRSSRRGRRADADADWRSPAAAATHSAVTSTSPSSQTHPMTIKTMSVNYRLSAAARSRAAANVEVSRQTSRLDQPNPIMPRSPARRRRSHRAAPTAIRSNGA